MNTQSIQNRIGKYQVIGVLSYGSTSHVFKITEIKSHNTLSATSNQIKNDSQIVSINMNYNQNSNLKEGEKQQEESKKDWILKLYNMELIKDNKFLEGVNYDIFAQILFLTYLNHPGIVKPKQMILEYVNNPNPTDPTKNMRKLIRAGIVMQTCEKGTFDSLTSYINRTKNLKQNKVGIMKFYLTQVANTLIYLNQECKLLHRDLKVQNIMVNKQLDIKVIDFGVSKINLSFLEQIFSHPQKLIIFQLFGFDPAITVKELYTQIRNNQTRRKNLIGSKHYISPELVWKYRSDMELVDEAYEKTDIWSFGVFMYRIFHDKYPFEGRNIRQILEKILDEENQAQIDKDLPEQVQQVISKCLKKDYTERASWKQLIKMKYFVSMPVNKIFSVVSPIRQLIMLNKQQKQKILLNTDRIYFDQKLVVKYKNQGNKKRRVMVIKQKDQSCPKLLVLKEKQSISMQILLSDRNALKISQQQKYIQIQPHYDHFDNTLLICNETSKEYTDKLVASIFQAIQLQQSTQKQPKEGINQLPSSLIH